MIEPLYDSEGKLKPEADLPIIPEVKKEEPKPFTFDANAVMFVLYLFYKDNVISNHNLKHMLKIIKDPMPEDVIKFIAEEAGKAV